MIKAKCATTENPQANPMLETVHQVKANLLRTFDLQNNHLDKEEPCSGILAYTYFSLYSMYHTILHTTPVPLVLQLLVHINNN